MTLKGGPESIAFPFVRRQLMRSEAKGTGVSSEPNSKKEIRRNKEKVSNQKPPKQISLNFFNQYI